MTETAEVLRFPIGKFEKPELFDKSLFEKWIVDLQEFPALLSQTVNQLSEDEFDLRYRPDGWMIRQVVHHCADSHVNFLIRMKCALTEDKPVIKPYKEALWAELPDALELPVSVSLQMLESVHAKIAYLLKWVSAEQLERIYIHPEYNKEYSLWGATGVYSWHCRHHLAHIQQALKMKFRE